MILYDITLATPLENIRLDEVLLNAAESGEGGEVLRFWESPEYFIVLGKIGKEEDDLHAENIKKDGILVLRRASGGGTVVQGPGCLNFTFILSKERNFILNDLKKSYRFILDQVINALKEQGIKAIFQPISDLALEENLKKFSGNAQKRGRKYILHHGTILYNFDLNKIERYLKFPKDVPEYRKGRGHLEFVTNVALDVLQFKRTLQKILAISDVKTKLDDKMKSKLI